MSPSRVRRLYLEYLLEHFGRVDRSLGSPLYFVPSLMAMPSAPNDVDFVALCNVSPWERFPTFGPDTRWWDRSVINTLDVNMQESVLAAQAVTLLRFEVGMIALGV